MDPALTITLQNEIIQSNATYNEKSRQLHASLERHKQQRANNRSRIVRTLHFIVRPFLTPSLVKATIGHHIIRDQIGGSRDVGRRPAECCLGHRREEGPH